jgi:hypothetical protein
LPSSYPSDYQPLPPGIFTLVTPSNWPPLALNVTKFARLGK